MIPYIQLHEFGGLLFSDVNAFMESFSEDEIDMNVLMEAANSFENPELINDSPLTAPSKRLEKAIVGYSKVLYGNYLAMDIGLDTIRNKCPLFNECLLASIKDFCLLCKNSGGIFYIWTTTIAKILHSLLMKRNCLMKSRLKYVV